VLLPARAGSAIFPWFSKESGMRWETPQAIDFRFGMEITLYIARR
jgi:coenzyme PQQ precursor peptide PqqA